MVTMLLRQVALEGGGVFRRLLNERGRLREFAVKRMPRDAIEERPPGGGEVRQVSPIVQQAWISISKSESISISIPIVGKPCRSIRCSVFDTWKLSFSTLSA